MGKRFDVSVEFRPSVGANHKQYPYMVGFTIPHDVNFNKVDDPEEKYRLNNCIDYEQIKQEWFGVKTLEACHDLFEKVGRVLKAQSNSELDVHLAKPEPKLFDEAQRVFVAQQAKDPH
jgi:hypothetical protein